MSNFINSVLNVTKTKFTRPDIFEQLNEQVETYARNRETFLPEIAMHLNRNKVLTDAGLEPEPLPVRLANFVQLQRTIEGTLAAIQLDLLTTEEFMSVDRDLLSKV